MLDYYYNRSMARTSFTLVMLAVAGSMALLLGVYWQNRFVGSPDVLGKSINFDKRSAQIIGVMPEDCQLPFKEAPFWLLNTADPRWKGPYCPNWRAPDAFAAVGRAVRRGEDALAPGGAVSCR